MTDYTFHVKLIAYLVDLYDYCTYVFENLDYKDVDFKYIMCTKFPNWNTKEIKVGDIGYVLVRYITAGDKYYNGQIFNTYNYTNVQFLKFVEEQTKETEDLIMD